MPVLAQIPVRCPPVPANLPKRQNPRGATEMDRDGGAISHHSLTHHRPR